MEYRVITHGDIGDLFAVRTATDENNYTLQELHSLGITEDSVRQKLIGNYKGWLCRVDDRTVGFDKGIGSGLLRLVEDWLWESGCAELWLTTDVDTRLRAYSFYRKNGWEDDRVEDGLRYMKKRKSSGMALPPT